MGADLYIRSLWQEGQRKHNDAYQAALAERNRLSELHPERHCTDDDCHPDLKAAQDEVWRLSDLMDGGCTWRDSYNSSNLFAQIGLGWDDVPLTELTVQSRYANHPNPQYRDDSGEAYEICALDADGLRWLINELKTRQIGNDYAETSESKLGASVFAAIASVAGPGCTVEGSPPSPNLSADDLAYFVAKKARLIAFCEKALELGEPIEVSY